VGGFRRCCLGWLAVGLWWLGVSCVGRVDFTEIGRTMGKGFRRDLVY
jgi:hypothetical protein